MSLKKKIVGNGVANILQKIVRILEQLFLIPFFISSWGTAYYGEWLTLTIIPSVLAFSDLGFGSAAANSFVLKYAAGDKKSAADISKTGIVIISYAILAGIIITGIGLFLALELNWFQKLIIPTNEAVISLMLMILARFIGFYNQLFGANFIAARKAALGINLSTINSVLFILAGVIVLLLGGNIVQYALWQFIVSALFNIFYWRIALVTLGLNREYKGFYNKAFAKEIFSKGLGYLMTPMWQSILFQGTTFIVRITLGPAAVAIFNTVRTLSRSVNHLYSIVNASIFPELQFELGIGNLNKAQKIFVYSIRISFILSFFGVLFLAIFGLPLYNFWTHNQLEPPVVMWYIFLMGILLNAVWWTSVVVFRAMNRPYQLAVSGIVSSIISVLTSYFCCKSWGLTGAAIGSLVFEIIMMLYILSASCKLIGLPLRQIYKNQ